MVFPREILLNDYIQAIPEMTLFIHNVKCVPYPVPHRHIIYDPFQRRVILLQGRASR